MRHFRILAGCVAALLPWYAATAQTPPSQVAPTKPRLLVFILVDQMSDDLLDRYGSYMRKGFRRLLDGGRRFRNAVVDHAPTNSLPGHLSAATGAYPRRHGIIDNNWIEMGTGKPVRVLGFSDPDCPAAAVRGTLQEPSGTAQAGIGPGRFESPTIVEWILAADERAKFASVGTGGGVSVLHAGKVKGPVLWYSSRAGEYVTGTCYLPQLPPWAVAFNSRLKATHMSRDWTLSAPPSMTRLAGRDAAAHENGGKDYAFPHRRPEDPAKLPGWFVSTPLADNATLALAEAAVVGEDLGRDDVPDIVTIGLSTLDHVGHAFGPTSVEQADTLFRMDQSLGAFFDFLDRQVGKDRWTLALTADHGAPPAPEDARRFGMTNARRVSASEASKATDAIVAAAEQFQDPPRRMVAAAEAASKIDFVARALTAAEVGRGSSSTDPIVRLYANSYRPDRVSTHPLYNSESGRSVAEFGIIVLPKPNVVVDWAASIHGSPYAYDRNVEMIFYGSGVSAGVTGELARTIDVAPSLAGLAGIAPVSEIDGRPLRFQQR